MKTPLAHVLLVSAFALAAGCSRDEQGAAPAKAAADGPSPVAPEAYMKDPAFRAKLSERNASRAGLANARATVAARMAEMIEAKKKELGTGDEAALKAALEKDPEWNSLHAQCVDANTALEEDRRETLRIVRERLTGQKK